MPARASSPRDVLAYWFSPRTARHWFRSGHELDRPVRARFRGLHRVAASGRLADWLETPAGALALSIVLDQFPRNIYRDTPDAFATDALAREVADAAIARGHDRAAPVPRRLFFYLPFEHSEDLADQERAIALFRARCNLFDYIDYAERHRDVIARFGRFPHRNPLLGREHTPEEKAWLESRDTPF